LILRIVEGVEGEKAGNFRAAMQRRRENQPQTSLTRVNTYQRITVNEFDELNEFELIQLLACFL